MLGLPGEGLCASVLSVHLSVHLSLQIDQGGRTSFLMGLEVGVGAGCAQKWEVGSQLWNCLEMGRSQDNGLDFLGLSWWALAQAETGQNPRLGV